MFYNGRKEEYCKCSRAVLTCMGP